MEGKMNSIVTSDSFAPTGLIDLLRENMDNEETSDVLLEGADGKTVPACRCLLALRSEVFRKMLQVNGNFKESQDRVVTLPRFSSAVIRTVREYCYFDSIKSLEECEDEDTARLLIQLIDAARFFQLSNLEALASTRAHLLMSKHPCLACAVLDESEAIPEANDGTENADFPSAMCYISYNPAAALLEECGSRGGGVQALGRSAILLVVNDDELKADELMKFRLLKKWADCEEEGEEEDDRRTVAMKMVASSVKLARIEPPDLSSAFVAESGLVTPEQIAQAYKEQAHLAHREGTKFSSLCSTSKQGGGTPSFKGKRRILRVRRDKGEASSVLSSAPQSAEDSPRGVDEIISQNEPVHSPRKEE